MIMSAKISIPEKIFLPIVVFSTIGFAVLDQAVKKIALSQFSVAPIYFNDFFSLETHKNYGIAFGLPVNAGVFYLFVLLFFAYLASGKLLNFREMEKEEILAIGFILSGALGNLIDRIRFGYIIDYANLGDIVIFNLADIFIAVGILILSVKIISDKKLKKYDN